MKWGAILSLFANCALAVLLLASRSQAPEAEPVAAAVVSAGVARPAAMLETNVVEVVRTVTNATPEFTWALVESEDYAGYQANLRRLKCPEWLVRDLILLELRRHYDRREMWETRRRPNYWVNYRQRVQQERERAEGETGLLLEERTVMRQLTGTYRHEEADDIMRMSELVWVTGVLPEPVAWEALSEIMLQHGLKELFEDQLVLIAPSDRLVLQAQFDEVKRRVHALAAPAVMEEFWLRLQLVISAMDNDLELPGVSLSGPQLRELVRIRSQFIDPIEREFTDGKEPAGPALAQLELQIQEALATVLGADVAQQYARSQNPAFRSIHNFTEQQQLPVESAIFIYDVRQAAIDEVRSVMTNPEVDPAQRLDHRQMVQRETEALLFDALGPEVFLNYKEGEGAWLNRVGGAVPTDDAGGAR